MNKNHPWTRLLQNGAALLVLTTLFAFPSHAQEAQNTQESAKAQEEAQNTPEQKAQIAWLEKRFGKELVNAQGAKIATSTLAGKTIGVYFSAHWCPPCRQFTPNLVKFRNAVAGNNFEIVFVSCDHDKKGMDGYMKEAKMPWPAIPFGASQQEALATEFKVRGIPCLVILDKDGKLITKDGRDDVAGKGNKAL